MSIYSNELDFKNYILNNFIYNSETGEIKRTDRRSSCGSLDKDGYLIIKIKGKQFKSHRIAWLLHYGVFPTKIIDHINRIKTDNRIKNLREVDYKTNNNNKIFKPNEKTGVSGIYLDECTKGLRKKYSFKHEGKSYRFLTLDEAVAKKEELKNGN